VEFVLTTLYRFDEFFVQCIQYHTRMLYYRKDVRAMHNPTIRSWFEARKSILPSSTDCWAVRAKIRQKLPSRWP